jgi:tetratricopeptide (TPR) repeat protein
MTRSVAESDRGGQHHEAMMSAGGASDTPTGRAYALYRAGKFKEAAEILIATIKSDPGSTGTYRLLAEVERSLGNRVAEAAVLEELVSIEPLSGELWARLASLHSECGRSEEAYRAYRSASQLLPSSSVNWEGVARTALATQRFSRASEARDRLFKHFPERATSHLLNGHLQKALGNADASRAAYENALSIDPNFSEAIYNLVDLQPPTPIDPLTSRVEALIQSPGIGDTDVANLNFALGRVFEAAKVHDRAFAHYDLANAAAIRVMRAKGFTYQTADSEESVRQIRATYPPSVFGQPIEPMPIDLHLIFIVGMPRSGTSMVEQIFARHPKVAAGGELPIANDCEAFHVQRRHESGLQGPIDPTDEREHDLLREARQFYLDQLFERGLDADFVTDKMPGNFSRVGFLRLLFPEATIVHCRRHPIATCWSLFASNFALHNPYYNSLGHLAHYYGCYGRLMAHWRETLTPAMTETRYEDLVETPEGEIRRLLGETGLEWDDRCMQFNEIHAPILTASYQQVRKPIYSSSVHRWRDFEPHLSALASLR